MGGATLLAALIVAVMASRHVSRLQREIERQRAAEQRNRQDLERLSARLVDAQEAERRKLARELHDAVGQALTAVKMDIGIALRSDNRLRVKDALEEASELTETTLRGVRDLSQLLHPSMLDDFGLPTTLVTYLRSILSVLLNLVLILSILDIFGVKKVDLASGVRGLYEWVERQLAEAPLATA